MIRSKRKKAPTRPKRKKPESSNAVPSSGLIPPYDLIDNINDSVFVVEPETGCFLFVNQTACKSLGYTRQELLGMSVQDIQNKPMSALAWGKFVEGVRREGVRLFENEHNRKDGVLNQVEISTKFVAVEGGEYLLAVVRNIGKRKQLENELRQAQKMEAIGRLAAGVAHDFNNILTSFLVGCGLLEKFIRPGHPAWEDLAEMKKAAERATELTSHLLAFGRKRMINPVVLDLNRVVKGMQGMLRRLIGEQIELTVKRQRTVDPIFADPSEMEQILMNLVVNASHSMPRGGVISIKTYNKKITKKEASRFVGLKPDNYVVMEIADTGVGMSQEVLSHLFEPFYTTKSGGLGMGLSTVYGIVKQCGGYIDVSSEPERGTVFLVFVPRTYKKFVPVVVPPIDQRPMKSSRQILIVEDDNSVRYNLKRILQGEGFFVLESPSASHALQISEGFEGKLDLLIVDVVMPMMSGKDLAKRFLKQRPDTKVLYISGYTEDNAILRNLSDSQKNFFLKKPFTPQELIHKIRKILVLKDEELTPVS